MTWPAICPSASQTSCHPSKDFSSVSEHTCHQLSSLPAFNKKEFLILAAPLLQHTRHWVLSLSLAFVHLPVSSPSCTPLHDGYESFLSSSPSLTFTPRSCSSQQMTSPVLKELGHLTSSPLQSPVTLLLVFPWFLAT